MMKFLVLVSLLFSASSVHSASIVHGHDLLSELDQLQNSLAHLQTILTDSAVSHDQDLLSRAAKVLRRARWLVYSTKRSSVQRDQVANDYKNNNNNSNIKSIRHGGRKAQSTEDKEERDLYETIITFPECRELFLQDCLQVISNELASLQLSAEIIVREKRSLDQPGYNKVVIITDLAATSVKGKNSDGIVTYPFMWDDALLGLHLLGVDGKWDCKALTPEECCARIKESAPNPDNRGNYLQCHIFVPYGGVGNAMRSDRVIVNLSQDGRVQEDPMVV